MYMAGYDTGPPVVLSAAEVDKALDHLKRNDSRLGRVSLASPRQSNHLRYSPIFGRQQSTSQ
eukprot:scaffold332341_cov19-Prasinocladus_malaysianus.AAC.1